MLLAKDRPKITGSIVKGLHRCKCMNEIKRRDKDSEEGYVNEFLNEVDNLGKEDKGKGKGKLKK